MARHIPATGEHIEILHSREGGHRTILFRIASMSSPPADAGFAAGLEGEYVVVVVVGVTFAAGEAAGMVVAVIGFCCGAVSSITLTAVST